MNNTTYSPKASEIEKKWYIIDAAGKPVGRVAVEAAKILRGKHKPTYTPIQAIISIMYINSFFISKYN